MYLEHFNFSSWPFSIAPNPRFVYLGAQHREALAHLLYGLQMGGGFVALTGEVGTGKTTLCRCLLEQLPDDVDIALIFNPRLGNRELLATICDELHIPNPGPSASNKTLIDLLNHHLLDTHAKGRRTVLLIDEAQNLRHDVLEQVRLLTNLETNETKLLQIILVGQPELRDILATSSLRQLSQRITARYHLGALPQSETRAYIEHRLAVSGGRHRIFSAAAISRIHGLSKGIPRLINLLCDRSLLGAYSLGRIDVTPAIVNKAAKEILAQPSPPSWRVRPSVALLAAGVLGLAAVHWLGGERRLLEGVETLRSPRLAGSTQGVSPIEVERPRTGSLARNETPQQPPAPPDSAAPLTDRLSEWPALIPTPLLEWATSTSTGSPTPAPAPTTPLQVPKTGRAVLEEALNAAAANLADGMGPLFALWGVQGWQGGDENLFARSNGLRCYRLEGTWDELIRLNHPALLEFGLSAQNLRYALLVGLDGGNPVLSFNGQNVTVARADFDVYWSGRSILLWKPPTGYAGSIEQGRRGPAVAWLKQRLGVTAKSGQEQAYDGPLAGRIAAYQREHGLREDASAGPMTMIYLNAEQADGPRLGLQAKAAQN